MQVLRASGYISILNKFKPPWDTIVSAEVGRSLGTHCLYDMYQLHLSAPSKNITLDPTSYLSGLKTKYEHKQNHKQLYILAAQEPLKTNRMYRA